MNVNKNVKEKLSLGFGVTKIKTNTAGACFQKSGHNQPPTPPSLIGLRLVILPCLKFSNFP